MAEANRSEFQAFDQPSVASDGTLSAEALARFERDGFLDLGRIASEGEVLALKGNFDRVFSELTENGSRDFFNFGGTAKDPKAYQMPQLEHLSQYMPLLPTLDCAKRAHGIARSLLGPTVKPLFEFGLNKAPQSRLATPWHQDIAFVYDRSYFEMITIWMPLQHVDMANGCLRYMPGTHKGPVVPHHSVEGNRRGLAADDFPTDGAIDCPLRAGEAVVHHFRTLHAAEGNATDEPRRAIAWGFGVRRAKPTVDGFFPWTREAHDKQEKLRSILRHPMLLDPVNRLKLLLGIK
ncbi:phytanoyl-CoA dioxygenase family protein [Oryzibacter oryziterrae]|uniref:phytanoyl-CoA dioxygenase family protein n=1 Tax=Oryzibacter oryziterrae TaxID=2766474 RepID=UPI001F26FB0E|nr:phytanoyl-CoA dioxygenase family protein [Oryzibacter oryziterrae]